MLQAAGRLDPSWTKRGIMKILITGSGAKELALARNFETEGEHEVLVLPGNPGTDQFSRETGAAIDCITNKNELEQSAEEFQPDLIFITDETFAESGLAETLQAHGWRVFGPAGESAAFLQNKPALDEYMKNHRLPSPVRKVVRGIEEAREWIFETEAPWVLQDVRDKETFAIAYSREEAEEILEDWQAKGITSLMISLFETGIRFNLTVLTSGGHTVPLQTVVIQRGIYEQEDDAQAKGAGALCPAQEVSIDEYLQAYEGILKPLLEQMAEDGMGYTGFVTGEFVVSERGVVCVNVKPGMPEGGAIVSSLRCRSDLASAASQLMEGVEMPLEWSDQHAAAICLMANGYPQEGSVGEPVVLDEEIEGYVFPHRMQEKDGQWQTCGGRVIMAAALGDDRAQAAENARETASHIHSDALFYRKDIGEQPR